MIDIEKCINDCINENMKGATEQQKQDFSEMATSFGNFMNCLWVQIERNGNGSDKTSS